MRKQLGKGLHELDLHFNAIADEGAIWIAEALPQGTLRRLDLRHNRIGSAGAMMLAHGMRENSSSLTHLDVSNNPIGAHGLGFLIRVKERCPKLRALGLQNVLAKAGDHPARIVDASAKISVVIMS